VRGVAAAEKRDSTFKTDTPEKRELKSKKDRRVQKEKVFPQDARGSKKGKKKQGGGGREECGII